MLKPTIDKQLYSWGTTKKPTASYSSEAPSGLTNVEYAKLQRSNINVPNPNNLGTRPVNLANSMYGWISGQGLTVTSPPVPSNLEYAALQQSDIVVPEPIIIPNFAELQFEEEGVINEQMPNVSPMQMADIILQYKKETQAADYQQWVVAITAYKKIMIAKTIRDLTDEEKRIMSVVEEQIKTEMKNISLNMPVQSPQPVAVQQPAAQPAQPAAQPAQPAAQQSVDDLIEQLRIAQSNTPQRWTQAEVNALNPPRPVFGPPVDSRPISRRLQRFGAITAAAVSSGAAAGLSGAITTIGLTEIARTVASLSVPDLSMLGSLLGVGASATAQTIVGAIANSSGEARLAAALSTLAVGGILNYYYISPEPGQAGVAEPAPPIIAVNPAVGIQLPVDVYQENRPVIVGADPGQGFNIIGYDPSQNPNNPWLAQMPGVGDQIAFPMAQPVDDSDEIDELFDKLESQTSYSKWVLSQAQPVLSSSSSSQTQPVLSSSSSSQTQPVLSTSIGSQMQPVLSSSSSSQTDVSISNNPVVVSWLDFHKERRSGDDGFLKMNELKRIAKEVTNIPDENIAAIRNKNQLWKILALPQYSDSLAAAIQNDFRNIL